MPRKPLDMTEGYGRVQRSGKAFAKKGPPFLAQPRTYLFRAIFFH